VRKGASSWGWEGARRLISSASQVDCAFASGGRDYAGWTYLGLQSRMEFSVHTPSYPKGREFISDDLYCQYISNRRPLLAQSEEKDALLASEPAMVPVLGFVGHSRLGCNAFRSLCLFPM
jgi:hypothetical protein